MNRKRGKAGIMVAALLVSALFAGSNVSRVDAGSPWKISDNDLSKTSDAVGMATYTYPDGWVCPTNSAYYVSSLRKLDENNNWVYLSDEEGEAFRARVEAQNPVDGSDDFLGKYSKGYHDVASSSYLSKEVTVVDGSTTTMLPSNFDPIWDDFKTYYLLQARDSSGEWTVVFEKYNLTSDYSFLWSDYLSDKYVYFVLDSKDYMGTDSNSYVKRFFVAEDKVDAMRAMISGATISDVTPASELVAKNTMYRLYNPNSGEHFYTADLEEAKRIKDAGWKYEGYAWKAPASSKTPVYRLYNPNSGEHHYTGDAAEKDNLVKLGWKDEGIGWYSDDNQKAPLYRLYNPNATGQYEAGGHHYTKDTAERDKLIKAGWIDEGIGWYGL